MNKIVRIFTFFVVPMFCLGMFFAAICNSMPDFGWVGGAIIGSAAGAICGFMSIHTFYYQHEGEVSN